MSDCSRPTLEKAMSLRSSVSAAKSCAPASSDCALAASGARAAPPAANAPACRKERRSRFGCDCASSLRPCDSSASFMAFSRVMRSSAYTPCAMTKTSALFDSATTAELTARTPCKKRQLPSKKCRRERDGFSPAPTAFVSLALLASVAIVVADAAHFALDVEIRFGHRFEVELGVAIVRALHLIA